MPENKETNNKIAHLNQHKNFKPQHIKPDIIAPITKFLGSILKANKVKWEENEKKISVCLPLADYTDKDFKEIPYVYIDLNKTQYDYIVEHTR